MPTVANQENGPSCEESCFGCGLARPQPGHTEESSKAQGYHGVGDSGEEKAAKRCAYLIEYMLGEEGGLTIHIDLF